MIVTRVGLGHSAAVTIAAQVRRRVRKANAKPMGLASVMMILFVGIGPENFVCNVPITTLPNRRFVCSTATLIPPAMGMPMPV